MEETGNRYIDFLLPGLLGMNLMGGGLFGVGFVLADMRVRKLLKRFLATPMKRRDFLLSVMLSRVLFTIPEVLVILLFGWLAFGVKNQGNLVSLILLIVLGASSFGGLGLLVASRAQDDRNRFGPDEPGHAADVHRVGRVLLVGTVSRNWCSHSSRSCR